MYKSQMYSNHLHTEHKQIHMVLKFHGDGNWEKPHKKTSWRGDNF